jgi:hypothetical protein
MKENVRNQLQMRLRRAAAAVLAIGTVAAGTVHSDPSNTACAVAGPTARDFGPIDTVLSYELAYELDRLFDVKQVHAQMTRTDTDITFMPTENGIYLIRHPAVEGIHQLMEIPPN